MQVFLAAKKVKLSILIDKVVAGRSNDLMIQQFTLDPFPWRSANQFTSSGLIGQPLRTPHAPPTSFLSLRAEGARLIKLDNQHQRLE